MEEKKILSPRTHLYTCTQGGTAINIQSGGKSGHLVSSDIYEGNPFGKSVECKPSTEILEGVGWVKAPNMTRRAETKWKKLE